MVLVMVFDGVYIHGDKLRLFLPVKHLPIWVVFHCPPFPMNLIGQ